PVPGRLRERGRDRVAGELLRGEGLGGELLQQVLLRRGGRRVDALVDRVAEAPRQRAVALRRVLAGRGDHLRGEEAEDEVVLVRGPRPAVPAQEGGAGA